MKLKIWPEHLFAKMPQKQYFPNSSEIPGGINPWNENSQEYVEEKGMSCSARRIPGGNRVMAYLPARHIGGWGVSPTRNSFRVVLCVRACVHAVWCPSGIGSQKRAPAFSFSPCCLFELCLFAFWLGRAFPFPLCDV